MAALAIWHPHSACALAMMLPDPAEPTVLHLPPAAIAPGDGEETVAEKSVPNIVTANFVSLEGASVDLTFQRQATLRAMQKQLCAAFGKNFPFTAAAVCIGEEAFSDFEDVPFRLASNYETVNVIFTR